MLRILLAILLALGLSPGLFWRSDPPPEDSSQAMELVALPLPEGDAARIGGPGSPVLTGAWRMESPNTSFGSYSAMIALDEGRSLLAFSDRGQFLRFPAPGAGSGPVAIGAVLPGSDDFKPLQDMEAATRDPATGRIWIGLEGRNAILRLEEDLSGPQFAYPPAMREWRSNSGPESLVRLTDGRFIVLSERSPAERGGPSEGLLFPGDPLEGHEPLRFLFAPPPGYAPTDMAQLPDGRALILLRRVTIGFPLLFTTRLVIADPAAIREGESWEWREVGALSAAMPRDNYEGLAITGGEDGGPVTIWLISDHNDAVLIQHTFLLRLEWTPG